jgi:hypothetical protein
MCDLSANPGGLRTTIGHWAIANRLLPARHPAPGATGREPQNFGSGGQARWTTYGRGGRNEGACLTTPETDCRSSRSLCRGSGRRIRLRPFGSEGGPGLKRSSGATVSVILLAVLSISSLAHAEFPPVKFVDVRSPVPRGGQGSATIHTKPNILCTIHVIHVMESRTSDAKGNITWTWKVLTETTPGTWRIIVTCGRGDITRIETTFDVT